MTIGAGRGDLTTKGLHLYSYIQRAGDPAHALELFSIYGALGGLSIPRNEPEAVYRKSLSQRGKWQYWTTNEGPPGDLPTTSFTEKMPRATATFLEDLAAGERPFTVHTIISESADPTDPTTWDSKEVLSGVRLSNIARDDSEPEEGDELEFTADAAFSNYARLYPMTFGAEAGTEITKEIVAVAVYPNDWRADADVKEIYAVQKVDTNPQLIYTKNGGQTWTKVGLTAMGTNEPSDIAVVGNYVIIVSSAGEAYYYTTKDALSTWTEITGGFVGGSGPTAIWAAGVGEIWMCGLSGYIYKLNIPGQAVQVIEDGDLTAQNFNAIHGIGNSILAVGGSNAAVLSQNRGTSFAALTGPEVGVALNACRMVGAKALWVGGAKLSYSLDAGVTWTEVATGIPNLATIQDIVFCPDQPAVGFIVGVDTAPLGVIKRTSDHGASWESNSINQPQSNEAITTLDVGGPNYLVSGGLVTVVGGDGTLDIAAS